MWYSFLVERLEAVASLMCMHFMSCIEGFHANLNCRSFKKKAPKAIKEVRKFVEELMGTVSLLQIGVVHEKYMEHRNICT
jgi:hypothetical protein